MEILHPAIAACFKALTLASACTVIEPPAVSFNPTVPQPKSTVSVQEAAALSERIARLQAQRNQVRAQTASEPDLWKRQSHYEELHRIGMELSPLERRMQSITATR